MTKKKIAANLENALLKDAPLKIELYKWELEEHVQYYFDSKKQDKDKYFVAITENKNDVAMLLIDERNNLHINEQAREKLKKIWDDQYEPNIKILIPQMAQDLFDGYVFISGIKEVKGMKRGWQG